MKRLSIVLLLMASCLPASRELLCRADGDCPTDETCEVVSGLCKPAASPSTFPASDEMGTFGVSGAFECPIVDPRTMQPGQQAIGRATVILGHTIQEGRRCAAAIGAPMMPMSKQGDKAPLTGLRTGCVVRRDSNRGVGPAQTRSYLELDFSQVDTTPDNPLAQMRFTLRESDLATGGLTVAGVVHGRFSERCKNDDGSTEIELRAIADQGSFEIIEFDQERLRGRFDVRLMMIEDNAQKTFGAECRTTRDCADGCALEELGSTECTSGTCVPELDDPSSGYGFCSANCGDAQDCNVDSDPLNFCLHRPMFRNGQCVRLCDPASDDCPSGQSCRPGTDFLEFFGEPGPSRCLDECIPTMSNSPPPRHCERPAEPGRRG